jgi:hypothetical protein
MDGKTEVNALGPRAEGVGTEAATVSVSATDTGVAVLGKERWEEIRRRRAQAAPDRAVREWAANDLVEFLKAAMSAEN